MTSTILGTLTSCALFGEQPVATRVDNSALCEALRPEYPLPVVQYRSKSDTPETIKRAMEANIQYRRANARFEAACPAK